jgi:hypothetical protein
MARESANGCTAGLPSRLMPRTPAHDSITRAGGVMPRWRRDGKELFYISPDSQMMAADVTTNPVFQAGTPHPLFQTEIADTGIRTGPMSWDIAPDGRFLIISERPPMHRSRWS